jgi:transposase InsO family protein
MAHEAVQEYLILDMVRNIRRRMPMIGGKKLHRMLSEDLSKLRDSVGRDKFFDILRRNGLLVKRLNRYAVTTNSRHWFYIYGNLVKGMTVDGPNRVFVADITYLRLQKGFCYLALVTDVYSRKIVGCDVSESLSFDGALRALKMALHGTRDPSKLIHHSDRGIQYCCHEYIDLLNKYGVSISMGEAGNPYDNAIAERVNGILKTEFLLDATFADLATATRAAHEAVITYNDFRPHMSIDYQTPTMKYAA